MVDGQNCLVVEVKESVGVAVAFWFLHLDVVSPQGKGSNSIL